MGRLLGSSMVGLMATSSKRPHAVSPRSAAPRAPAHVASHWWPVPPWEILKHSKAGLAQSLWGLGPGTHKVLFKPSELLCWVWGLILNVISPLLLSCWGFSFAFGMGYPLLLFFFLATASNWLKRLKLSFVHNLQVRWPWRLMKNTCLLDMTLLKEEHIDWGRTLSKVASNVFNFLSNFCCYMYFIYSKQIANYYCLW